MCLETILIAAGMEAVTAASVSSGIFTTSSILGVGMAAQGQYTTAQATKDQNAYKAQVASNNAIIRERQAMDTLERGDELAAQAKAKLKSIESTQLVTLAGQGGDVTTGTAVDLLAETQELGQLDVEKIRNNAAREANAIRADATNLRANAALAQLSSDAINPLLAAGTTVFSGLGKVGAQWYKR